MHSRWRRSSALTSKPITLTRTSAPVARSCLATAHGSPLQVSTPSLTRTTTFRSDGRPARSRPTASSAAAMGVIPVGRSARIFSAKRSGALGPRGARVSMSAQSSFRRCPYAVTATRASGGRSPSRPRRTSLAMSILPRPSIRPAMLPDASRIRWTLVAWARASTGNPATRTADTAATTRFVTGRLPPSLRDLDEVTAPGRGAPVHARDGELRLDRLDDDLPEPVLELAEHRPGPRTRQPLAGPEDDEPVADADVGLPAGIDVDLAVGEVDDVAGPGQGLHLGDDDPDGAVDRLPRGLAERRLLERLRPDVELPPAHEALRDVGGDPRLAGLRLGPRRLDHLTARPVAEPGVHAHVRG